jgi:hypothetical protein
MSLYREPGRLRRRRLAIAAGVAVAVLLVVAVILLVGGGSEPRTRADRAADVRAAASTASDGLELLLIEYAQAVHGGRVVEPTEYAAAQADVERARGALRGVAADARAVAPREARAVDAALAEAAAVVARRADGREVQALVAAAQRVLRRLMRVR